MKLHRICRILLDDASSKSLVKSALDDYSHTCARVTGITPDPGLDAWAQDSFLDSGVAINPRAAAHCVTDYRRTLVFIRSVHAAITKLLAAREAEAVRVLYAGCGPYATLLLPILGEFPAQRLQFQLLDVHQSALGSVQRLIEHFGLAEYEIDTLAVDASTYRCLHKPQLIVAETMQKALEQEPQFAVTANLAPQLDSEGIFIPERIDVDLCLTRADRRFSLGRVLSLSAARCRVPEPVEVCVPAEADLGSMRAELTTSIQVFEHHHLVPGEANITLGRPCPELSPLTAGAVFQVEFRAGTYPVFEISATC